MQTDISNERGEVLVAIMNDPADFIIAQERHWYRIPVKSAPKRWPPRWLAFYQTKIFGDEAFSVRYYARVDAIKTATRQELFPDEASNQKSKRIYHQLVLEPLESLPAPIFSRRFRRLVFIPTTWEKFTQAVEINDLYDESPLEDRLWAEFKRLQISAERQYYLQINDRNYCLDFALFCHNGKMDIETDGDRWHRLPKRIDKDNQRNNDVTMAGWYVFRFNSKQINNELHGYCIPTLVDSIKRMGGLEDAPILKPPAVFEQKQGELFEDSFHEIPEEVFTYPEKSVASKGSARRRGSLQPFQTELFEGMPKSTGKKNQRRKK